MRKLSVTMLKLTQENKPSFTVGDVWVFRSKMSTVVKQQVPTEQVRKRKWNPPQLVPKRKIAEERQLIIRDDVKTGYASGPGMDPVLQGRTTTAEYLAFKNFRITFIRLF